MAENTEVSFYRISATPIERALPKLLEKILQQNYSCLIKFEDNALMEELNSKLWSIGRKTFIPHGSINDKNPELQPVLLTTGAENLNSANLLITIGKSNFPESQVFGKVLHLFEDTSEEISWAREVYKTWQDAGYNINYFIQDSAGNWSKQ